jgi:hypothetical protein
VVILALILSPLAALAQSSSANVCETDCRFEYEIAVERCANQSDRAACDQAAALAMKTCLAWCPANR